MEWEDRFSCQVEDGRMGTRAGRGQSAVRARRPGGDPVDPNVAADTWLSLGAVRSRLPRLDHLSADGSRDRGRLARTAVCLNSIAEENHGRDRQGGGGGGGRVIDRTPR